MKKLELPSDRSGWKLKVLEEGRAGYPDLPSDLRRMSERQRLDLYAYLRSLPLQELKRNHDVIHSQQSELHQHLRYYGKNSSYERAFANLQVFDEMYQRVIEIVEEEYEEMLDKEYGIESEPAYAYKSWVLPKPDPNPNDFPKHDVGIVAGLENKYGVVFPGQGGR
jgi:predicted AlkP superfamily phosphohydrolase/phosphomutase